MAECRAAGKRFTKTVCNFKSDVRTRRRAVHIYHWPRRFYFGHFRFVSVVERHRVSAARLHRMCVRVCVVVVSHTKHNNNDNNNINIIIMWLIVDRIRITSQYNKNREVLCYYEKYFIFARVCTACFHVLLFLPRHISESKRFGSFCHIIIVIARLFYYIPRLKKTKITRAGFKLNSHICTTRYNIPYTWCNEFSA